MADDIMCVDCGEIGSYVAKEYTGPDTFNFVRVCEGCYDKRENREPPDADGEDLFRDYGAEARDRMDEARRLK
jgi:hypothetical protein